MRYFVAFLVFITTSHLTAQVPDLYNSISNDVYTIHSKILKQERQLYIHIPKRDSSEVDKVFPVLYLLDGENHFHIVSAYIDYLSHWQVIPKTIVVGIISIDRRKDLTPTNSLLNFDRKIDSSYKTTGGNENFLQFIQQELIPYVEANFKTSTLKILAGHSFGGITTLNCLFTHPDMFDAYIAVSPSLWWDNRYVLKLIGRKSKRLSTLNKKLFYSNGNEGGSFRNDIMELDSLMHRSNLKGFERKYVSYPHESHMTEAIPAYYDALRFIYKDWADTEKKK